MSGCINLRPVRPVFRPDLVLQQWQPDEDLAAGIQMASRRLKQSLGIGHMLQRMVHGDAIILAIMAVQFAARKRDA